MSLESVLKMFRNVGWYNLVFGTSSTAVVLAWYDVNAITNLRALHQQYGKY